MSQYDSPKHQVRRLLTHAPSATGLSVAGTNAADAVLLRIPLCENITVNGTARFRYTTGGTAAGPSITLGKSLAGTGAVVAFGTITSGTQANGAVGTMALTSTDFDPGDEIVVSVLAGTAAATPVVVFSLSYIETFE